MRARWILTAAVAPLSLVAAAMLWPRGNVASAIQDPPAAHSDAPATKAVPYDWDLPDRFRPGFDPTRDKLPAPKRGGRVTVHIENIPSSLNYLLESGGIARRIALETHESLVQRDWRTNDFVPVLAESFVVEDQLVLRDAKTAQPIYGRVTEEGDEYVVTPISGPVHALAKPVRVKKSDVDSVQRGTVFTFKLRPNVKWHDGKPLRVEDVLFSWRIAMNPGVECGNTRFQYQQIREVERVDERSVRFFFHKQYFLAIAVFEGLVLLPAHIYDLHDPSCAKFDASASDDACAKHVNENPANRMPIGLGPYRVTQFTNQFVEAERFDGYFDPAHAGWFDAIRWRYFADASTAMRALLEGELDFTGSVVADDFFGAATASEAFTSRFYKGWFYTPRMTYVAWNLKRAQFADPRVRRALAMSFDWDELIRSFYKGLAARVTSEIYDGSPSYDAGIAPVPFDPAGATKLLAEAGWIDRDGDGLLDREGVKFEFEFMLQAGNKVGDVFAQKYQENLKALGIRLIVAPRDWGSLNDRLDKLDFDSVMKAWVGPVERDPAQIWHSREAKPGTANVGQLADADVDRLIDALQVELDASKRGAIGRELHARLYALQPYMYGVKVPNKFAIDKRIRNFRTSACDPGYSIRDWYFAE
jgi:peptide/nickel transport system substrate-binding protein